MQKCCYFKIFIIFAIGCNKKDFYHLLDFPISNRATVFNYTYAKTIQDKINTETNLRW